MSLQTLACYTLVHVSLAEQMATPINLAIASPAVIKAWCNSIQISCLNDSFESKKIIPQEVQNFAQALQRVAAQPQAVGVGPELRVAQLGGLTIVTRLSTYTYTTVHLPHPSYRWLRRDARRAAAFEVRTHRVGTYEMPPRAQQ